MSTFEQILSRVGRTLTADSRKVEAGDVFVCLPPPAGAEDHSALHVADALKRGAAHVLCSDEVARNVAEGRERVLPCPDTRDALGHLARAAYNTAELPFPLVGVTGTNGKTTSVYLLEHLFNSRGGKAGVMGTVSYRWPGYEREAPLTTPDCLTLHRSLAAMKDAGVQAAFMEVSSHALDQKRVAGLAFNVAVFTNLTQDHLDYHKTMEAYFAVKAGLFMEGDARGVINADDPWGRELLALLARAGRPALAFGLNAPSGDYPHYLQGEVLSDSMDGLQLRLTLHRDGKSESWHCHSPLVGRHNASNLLGVMGAGLLLGAAPADFACFHEFYGVPGRLERIPNQRQLGVFVDYAHTPDALIRAQEALRDAGFARVITVFGCGGDRDRTKRPIMGEAVGMGSDVAVLTSDNPRTEEPEAIMDDVMPGLNRGKAEIHREADRRKAIALALNLARPHDAVLVAGKGHEPYQIIGTVKHPFSDQAILRELLPCA